jgi:hypothetical protein
MKLSSFVMLFSRDAKFYSWAMAELTLVVVVAKLTVVAVAATQVIAVVVAAIEVAAVVVMSLNWKI